MNRSNIFPGILRSALLVATSAIVVTSCSRFASVFYVHENPQALKRDTIKADGTRSSTIAYAAGKENGVIDLVAIDTREPLTPVTVDAGMAASQVGVFGEARSLMVPPGYKASVHAWGFSRPQDIVTLEDGSLFVSDIERGEIVHIGTDGSRAVIIDGLSSPHGLDIDGTTLYYAEITKISRYDFTKGNPTGGTSRMLTDRIPKGGDFYARTIRYRKSDGYLYVSVGATDANGEEKDQIHSTIFRVKADGGSATRYLISGLRNTSGLDFHPATGALWGVDQGMDNLAENLAPDEINILKSGGKYGHPYFYSQNYRNPQFADVSSVRVPSDPDAPVIEMEPFSGAIDAEFYEGNAFGPDGTNNLVVVLNGYTNGAVIRPSELRTGGKVVRIVSDSDGANARQIDLFSGWLTSSGDYWGRPAGVSWTQDGRTFFVTDEKNGVIYRFSK